MVVSDAVTIDIMHQSSRGVMPGLGPGIHAFLSTKTWMAGTSPAMTA
jgi:hypothetical protein